MAVVADVGVSAGTAVADVADAGAVVSAGAAVAVDAGGPEAELRAAGLALSAVPSAAPEVLEVADGWTVLEGAVAEAGGLDAGELDIGGP
jgi:hypothetical protein